MGTKHSKQRGSVSGFEIVQSKLLENSLHRSKIESDDILAKFAEALSDENKLKEKYLNTDWLETKKLYRRLCHQKKHKENENRTPDLQQRKKSRKPLSSFQSTQSVNWINAETDEEDELLEDIPDHEFIQAENYEKGELKHNVRLKIIVSEIAPNSKAKRKLRRLISPVLSTMDTIPELGLFHSAIVIGTWLLEFNNSSLVIPRRCVSRSALIAADVDYSIDTKQKMEEVVDTIAKVVCKWNTTMTYKDKGGDPKTEGNCQDFVNDLLKELNCDINFTGPLAKYLRKLKLEGKASLEFDMDDKFRNEFGIVDKKVKFKTHQQLDEFVMNLCEKDVDFKVNWKQEYMFLKSFDRSFWLKYFQSPSDARWKPLQKWENTEDGKQLCCNCIFEDPTKTHSFIL